MRMIPEETLNTDKIPVVVFISPGEKVEVEEKQKRATKPNYFMIGNGTMNKHRIYGIDLLRELANSTKAEQFLLLAIKDGICYGNDYSPIVKVIPETETQRQYIKLGYKSLSARELVIRVKKSHYMINPNALIPIDYEGSLRIWEEAVNKHTTRDS